MSILLDSLSQQNKTNENAEGFNTQNPAVPNLDVSHFDDEMLGDEWIIKRANQWKLVALMTIGLLVLSWGYFLYYEKTDDNQNKSEASSSSVSPSVIKPESTKILGNQEVVKSTLKQNKIESLQKNNFVKNQNDSVESFSMVSQIKKQQYKPEKRIVTASNKSDSNKENELSTKAIKVTKITEPAVFLEELSLQEQEDFPEIKIDSYIISDKPQESFVILDNKFYKMNQLISTDLILREITKENILLEYQSKLVKIPLNQ